MRAKPRHISNSNTFNLPGKGLWGYHIRPLHFGIFIATLGVAAQYLVYNVGALGESQWGDLVGSAAAVASILLVLSWIVGWVIGEEEGLLLAAGVWGARSAFYLIDPIGAGGGNGTNSTLFSPTVAFMISAGVTVFISGLYLIQMADRRLAAAGHTAEVVSE